MTGKNKININIASLSDVHLNHPRTPTTHIIKNLNTDFPDNAETGELDLIFIAGDLFDSPLPFYDNVVDEIQLWMLRLFRICHVWNIALRVLEGTKSHDRGQSKRFDAVLEMANLDVDFKYVDTLSIEHMEKLDIDILYVPDEWDVDTDKTWLAVQDLMAQKQIKKVDFSVMHGQFEHQLEYAPHAPIHVAQRYLDITRFFIFIGHVHTMSIFERILAHGSYDRLAMNEEEDKGHFRVIVDTSDVTKSKIRFVVNKGAMRYNTYDISKMKNEDLEGYLTKKLEAIEESSYIRFVTTNDTFKLATIDSIIAAFPMHKYRMKKIKENGEVNKETISVQVDAIPINDRTIIDLIKKRLEERDLANDFKGGILSKLESVIKEVG